MSISSTASSALRPRHGAPAACALSPLNDVLDRDEAGAVAVAPGDAEVVADVREERDVDVLEEPGADEVRLRADELLGHPGQIRIVPGSFSRSMIFFTASAAVMLSGLAGVVPFAVTGRAFDHRIVVGDARLLRRLRDAVDVGAERDHRLARSPRRHQRGRNAGDALLHGEAVLLEDVGQVRLVSNSWKPSSPKLKTWSTICWVKVCIPSTSATASAFSFWVRASSFAASG